MLRWSPQILGGEITADVDASRDAHRSGIVAAPWLVAVVAIVAAGSLVVARFIGGQGHMSGGPVTETANLSAHCSQFIALARAKYGTNWKYRLDPRDSLCAQQVEEEWVRQWSFPRPQSPSPPAAVASTAVAPAPPAAPAAEPAAQTARQRNPETYCLNVISLARAKFGAEWKSKVSPQEAASCKDEIAKIQGR